MIKVKFQKLASFCFQINELVLSLQENFWDLDEKLNKELTQELTSYHIMASKLPPLTAHIFAYILVNCDEEGFTFDDLVQIFQASKSSVSKSLNLLLQQEYITHYIKMGERKRRYRISADHINIQLKKIKKILEREKYLTEKLMKYRIEHEKTSDPMKIDVVNLYTEHLEGAVERLEETITKIQKIKDQNS